MKLLVVALYLHDAGLYADARTSYIAALKNSSEFIPRETILEKLRQLKVEEATANRSEP